VSLSLQCVRDMHCEFYLCSPVTAPNARVVSGSASLSAATLGFLEKYCLYPRHFFVIYLKNCRVDFVGVTLRRVTGTDTVDGVLCPMVAETTKVRRFAS